MQELILEKIKEIEEQFQVKVLYAAEAGSRAWGYSSQNSDYDVRFIYVQQIDWYLSIDPQGVGAMRDVIELPINDQLDLSGWELTKALRLFRKSNPSLMEILKSKTIYYEQIDFRQKLHQMEPVVFNPIVFLHHYLNMAKSNFNKSLQTDQVKIKMYFHVLRPILSCQWVETFKTVPPNDLGILMEMLIYDVELKTEVNFLLKRKVKGDQICDQLPILHTFLANEISRMEDLLKTVKVKLNNPTAQLNEFFREVLRKIW